MAIRKPDISKVKKDLVVFLSKIGLTYSEPKQTETPKDVISSDKRHQIFREFITCRVAEGWVIEIENEFDAVLSKKDRFPWFWKLIFFLFLLFVFAPLALFYLVIVVVMGVTAKPWRVHFRINEFGQVSPPLFGR